MQGDAPWNPRQGALPSGLPAVVALTPWSAPLDGTQQEERSGGTR